MRVALGLLFVVFVIFSFSFAAVKINKIVESKNTHEDGLVSFSTFTSAVCENSGEFVRCKDELFVSCNGKALKADEIESCNGIGIKNEVSGFAIFEKEWQDPRI